MTNYFTIQIRYKDGSESEDNEIVIIATSFDEAEKQAKEYLKEGEEIIKIQRLK